MARKRLRMYDYMGVIDALRRGDTERSIARQGLASRNTIKTIRERADAKGWLQPGSSAPSQEDVAGCFLRELSATTPQQSSKVAAFETKMRHWISTGYKPKQIYRKLMDLVRTDPSAPVFQGSLGSVKRYIQRLSDATPEVHVVMHYEPGEAVQVDFGNGPKLPHPSSGKLEQTYVFVMTMCHSRHLYVELVWNQKAETWLRCHQNAFQFFGGVPQRVIIDNLKAAITRACVRDPVVHRSYHEFAALWGFKIDPNPPKCPWLKGRVESGVKYVKGAVLCRDFTTFSDLQNALDEFVMGEAGNRIHGTTKQRPLTLFVEEDKPALASIPKPVPDIVHWARLKVHTTTHVYFAGGYYSVPFSHVGKHVWLKAGLKLVTLHDDLTNALIATHPVTTRTGQFRTNIDHYPPGKRGPMELNGENCIKQATALGIHVGRFVETLLGDKVLERLQAARGILALASKFGPRRLDAACDRALQHDLITYAGVKRILERGLDQVTVAGSGQLPFPEFAPTRFARCIGSMMSEGAYDVSA